MIALVALVLGLSSQCFAAVAPPYTTPSEEVGKAMRQYNSSVDPRRAWELGFGHYFQGDIMLRPEDYKAANGIPLTSTNRWPNGIIPYVITGNFSSSDLTNIQWAIAHYKNNSCIRFIPRTTETIYVTIKNDAVGCWSYMGRSTSNTGNQINLQTPGCTSTGTIVHEMMHCAGFHHEQVRPDRDQWISINRTALLPQYQTDSFFNTNFGLYSQGVLYGLSYDYGSVMHYSKWGGAASWNYPVMNNIKPWVGDFGNNVGFSSQDIVELNIMYNSSICQVPTPAPSTTTTTTTTTKTTPTTTTTKTTPTTTTTKTTPTTTTTKTTPTTTTTKTTSTTTTTKTTPTTTTTKTTPTTTTTKTTPTTTKITPTTTTTKATSITTRTTRTQFPTQAP